MIKPATYGVISDASTSKNFVGKMIRLCTRSLYSHAFLVMDKNQVAEAGGKGIVMDSFESYKGRHCAYNDEMPLTDDQRQKICAKALELVGTPYGFLDIVSLFFLSWGIRLSFIEKRVAREDRLICSQFVAVCYEAAGITLVPGKPAQEVTPGDLADVITDRKWAPAPW